MFDIRGEGRPFWRGLDPFEMNGFVLGGIIAFSVLLVAAIVTFCVLNHKSQKKNKNLFTTRDLTYGAITLGVSIALSYVSIRMPMGGRATLASSTAIMLYCFFFGYKKGMVVVSAFLAFQFIQGPTIVHFFSAILDYVIPYMALIFFGIFSRRWANKHNQDLQATFFIAGVLYVATRYLSHVLSGAIFFGQYAPETWAVLPYSLVYNMIWFAPDALFALMGGSILLSSKSVVKMLSVAGNSLPLAKEIAGDTSAILASSDMSILPSESTDTLMAVSGNTLQNTDTGEKHN